MLPAFQTYFILQIVYTKLRCPVSRLPECLPAGPSTLTHLWAQLIATLRPLLRLSPEPHTNLVLLPENHIYAKCRQQLFHQIWHGFRQWIKVFPQIIWFFIHQSVWDCLTE